MKANDVLFNHNLKRTACREGIIEVMSAADKALSESEIRDKLAGNYDRTTFYRSFKTLEEHKIIHKIVVDNLIVKYALDNSVTHKNEHIHFYCNDCNAVRCLDNLPVQEIRLPDGYTEIETEILVKGICDSCKNNS